MALSHRMSASGVGLRTSCERWALTCTGRQLFENSSTLATSDEALYEEGAASVDMSQYTREAREAERRREEEEAEKRRRGLLNDGDSDQE